MEDTPDDRRVLHDGRVLLDGMEQSISCVPCGKPHKTPLVF